MARQAGLITGLSVGYVNENDGQQAGLPGAYLDQTVSSITNHTQSVTITPSLAVAFVKSAARHLSVLVSPTLAASFAKGVKHFEAYTMSLGLTITRVTAHVAKVVATPSVALSFAKAVAKTVAAAPTIAATAAATTAQTFTQAISAVVTAAASVLPGFAVLIAAVPTIAVRLVKGVGKSVPILPTIAVATSKSVKKLVAGVVTLFTYVLNGHTQNFTQAVLALVGLSTFITKHVPKTLAAAPSLLVSIFARKAHYLTLLAQPTLAVSLVAGKVYRQLVSISATLAATLSTVSGHNYKQLIQAAVTGAVVGIPRAISKLVPILPVINVVVGTGTGLSVFAGQAVTGVVSIGKHVRTTLPAISGTLDASLIKAVSVSNSGLIGVTVTVGKAVYKNLAGVCQALARTIKGGFYSIILTTSPHIATRVLFGQARKQVVVTAVTGTVTVAARMAHVLALLAQPALSVVIGEARDVVQLLTAAAGVSVLQIMKAVAFRVLVQPKKPQVTTGSVVAAVLPTLNSGRVEVTWKEARDNVVKG